MASAVLVSSHILSELADVCDTVGILKEGNLLACGPVQQILRKTRQTRIVEIYTPSGVEQARRVLQSVAGHWQPLADDAVDGTIRYEVQADESQLRQALRLLIERGVPVVSFHAWSSPIIS